MYFSAIWLQVKVAVFLIPSLIERQKTLLFSKEKAQRLAGNENEMLHQALALTYVNIREHIKATLGASLKTLQPFERNRLLAHSMLFLLKTSRAAPIK